MADAPAVIEAPAETTMRPEAMEQLNRLSAEIHGDEPAAVDPNAGKEVVAPVTTAAPETKAPAITTTPPAAGVLPPEAGEPGTAETTTDDPTKFQSSKELFPTEEPPVALRTVESKANWHALRKNYTALETAYGDLQKKVAEQPKPDDVAQARITELETRLVEMTGAFERLGIENHPDFKKQFDAPIEKAAGAFVELATEAGVEQGEIERVLSLKKTARIKALGEVTAGIENVGIARRLERLVDDLEAKEGEKSKFLEDAKGNAERMRTQEKINQHQTFEQQAKRITGLGKEIIRFMAEDRQDPFFQRSKAPGSEQWNANLDKYEQEVIELLTKGTDEVEIYSNMALGKRYPALHKAYAAERQLRLAAEKALGDRRGAEPGLNGGGGAASGATEEIPVTADDFDSENIRSRLHRFRVGT